MNQARYSPELVRDVARRRTFAIISHPDAGKTTLTEKLLLYGGAIQMAGTVKARKSARHATSDWMEVEKQRGISVTSSVMQFDYADHTINLLDTPGHQDFSEDTYRVLTAVDAAVMVIDAAKGVEAQTIKLLEVCRLRATPIITFVNKMDREVREPLALLEEIESVLRIDCAPVTWPIGMGKRFRGVFDLRHDRLLRFTPGEERIADAEDSELIEGLDNPRLDELFPDEIAALRHDVDLIRHASTPFDLAEFLAGRQSPVFFGSGINNFGVQEILQALIDWAPPPQPRDGGIARRAAGRSRRSPASCSRSRRTWIRSIATASRSSASARAATARHESAAPAHRPRDEARQRADVHGERARGERGRGRRRHHRHPQPRAAADRRHADRRRGARLQGHSVFRARSSSASRGRAIRSRRSSCRRACRSWARKARSRCSSACTATRCCWAPSASCSSRSSPTGWRASTRSTRSTTRPASRPRAGSRIPTKRRAGTSSTSTRRRWRTDVDGNPVYLATNKYNLQVTMERWPKVGFHTTREHGQRLEHA